MCGEILVLHKDCTWMKQSSLFIPDREKESEGHVAIKTMDF